MQQASVNKEKHRKMVSSKKKKTGGRYGPATSPRRNRRHAESKVSREHNVYVVTKVDITLGAYASMELCTGYHKFLPTLKESKEACFSFP